MDREKRGRVLLIVSTTECYRTEAQMDKGEQPEAPLALEAFVLVHWSSALHRWKLSSIGLLRWQLCCNSQPEGPCPTSQRTDLTMTPVATRSRASAATFYDTTGGSGIYPGSTAANVWSSSMASLWDNRVGSVYIRENGRGRRGHTLFVHLHHRGPAGHECAACYIVQGPRTAGSDGPQESAADGVRLGSWAAERNTETNASDGIPLLSHRPARPTAGAPVTSELSTSSAGDKPSDASSRATSELVHMAACIGSTEVAVPRGARRRRLWWLAAATVLVVVGVGGWVVGQQVQSSDQAASLAAPPTPSWIAADVEQRVLAQTVISRGDVRPQVSILLGVPSSIEGSPVLTAIGVRVGDAVTEGTRVMEVSGRPVFVLRGDVPVYRSLRPGMTGERCRAAAVGVESCRLRHDPPTRVSTR